MLDSKQKELDGLQETLASVQQIKNSLEQQLLELVRDWFLRIAFLFICERETWLLQRFSVIISLVYCVTSIK